MLTIRDAKASDCDDIAAMVLALAREIGATKVPKIDGDALRLHGFGKDALVMLSVAEGSGGLVGCCVTTLTFSTWRAVKGLYVVDLYVTSTARSAGVGEKLLRHAAQRGWRNGARFIRMEVDKTNKGAERFYQRLGFAANDADRFWALEEKEMKEIVKD